MRHLWFLIFYLHFLLLSQIITVKLGVLAFPKNFLSEEHQRLKMDLTLIIAGVAALLLGRQLFWLFIAVVGFTAGLAFAQSELIHQPQWMIWAVGLAVGIVSLILALFIQKLAIVLGGFAAGAFVAMRLGFLWGNELHPAAVLLAGVAGAVLLYIFFDWALIVLSSAAGAALIIEGAPALPVPDLGLFWCLAILGIIIQTLLMRKIPAKKSPPHEP